MGHGQFGGIAGIGQIGKRWSSSHFEQSFFPNSEAQLFPNFEQFFAEFRACVVTESRAIFFPEFEPLVFPSFEQSFFPECRAFVAPEFLAIFFSESRAVIVPDSGYSSAQITFFFPTDSHFSF